MAARLYAAASARSAHCLSKTVMSHLTVRPAATERGEHCSVSECACKRQQQRSLVGETTGMEEEGRG